MLEWVEVVLKPYVALAPPHIVPIVLLDSFKVHMVGSVTSAIQALGCEVMFIPPGCTGLVQPWVQQTLQGEAPRAIQRMDDAPGPRQADSFFQPPRRCRMDHRG